MISQKIDCLYQGKDTLDLINNYFGLFTYMIGFASLIFLAIPFISYLPNYIKEIRNNFGYTCKELELSLFEGGIRGDWAEAMKIASSIKKGDILSRIRYESIYNNITSNANPELPLNFIVKSREHCSDDFFKTNDKTKVFLKEILICYMIMRMKYFNMSSLESHKVYIDTVKLLISEVTMYSLLRYMHSGTGFTISYVFKKRINDTLSLSNEDISKASRNEDVLIQVLNDYRKQDNYLIKSLFCKDYINIFSDSIEICHQILDGYGMTIKVERYCIEQNQDRRAHPTVIPTLAPRRIESFKDPLTNLISNRGFCTSRGNVTPHIGVLR